MATAIAAAAQAPSIFPPDVEEIRLEIFDRVPPRCFVQAVTDNGSAPLLRAGEVAVAEGDGGAGWIPIDGGLFVIEYVSPPDVPDGFELRTRKIVQTRRLNWPGQDVWAVAAYASPRNEAEHDRAMRRDGVFHVADFPYTFDALARKLIGRVVGIYCPAALRCDGRA
ncbi:MAG TPA: hypothetical protein VGF77_13320 [Allosphingosinicella sp.]|jgi:hypothetical protein